MKDISHLLLNIDCFSILAGAGPETITIKMALTREHALDQARRRAVDSNGNPDKRLAEYAVDDILNVIYSVQKSKEIFDKIPPDSKWIVESVGNLKAVVQKIFENNQWKFILKTFLEPHHRETNISGNLKEYISQLLVESKNSEVLGKIAERKKSIKALEKLLERKLPMPLETLQKNSSPEFWSKLTGFISTIKDGIVTSESVARYKIQLEVENANAMKLLVK